MGKKKEYWYEVIIKGDFDKDLISGVMYFLGCMGIVEERDCLKVYFSAEAGLSKERIEEELAQYGVKGVNVETGVLFDDGWSKRWEKYFEPVRVGKRIYIRPPWKEPPAEGFIDIVINPGGAFGTGTHPTTQMALYFLEEYVENGMNVLDAGCGSGILAIASVKLGAKKVLCVDNDEQIRDNFEENVVMNGVQERVKLRICDVMGIGSFDFDLVVSNIDIKSNLKLLNSIRSFGKFPHRMIFTGILEKDMSSFIENLEQVGLKVVNTGTLKEWGAVVV